MEQPNSHWSEKDWDTFSHWLKGVLKVSDGTITFIKKDGTERVMNCTLNPEKLPKQEITEGKKERRKNNDTMAVYDIDANGWRSFTIKSVKSVTIPLVALHD